MDEILKRIKSEKGQRGHLPQFTEIVDPLANLLPKDVSFWWGINKRLLLSV